MPCSVNSPAMKKNNKQHADKERLQQHIRALESKMSRDWEKLGAYLSAGKHDRQPGRSFFTAAVASGARTLMNNIAARLPVYFLHRFKK